MFTGQTLFVISNEQCHSIEGKIWYANLQSFAITRNNITRFFVVLWADFAFQVDSFINSLMLCEVLFQLEHWHHITNAAAVWNLLACVICRLLSQHDICLIQALCDDPLYRDLLDKVNQSSVLKEKLLDRTSTLQVSVVHYHLLSGCHWFTDCLDHPFYQVTFLCLFFTRTLIEIRVHNDQHNCASTCSWWWRWWYDYRYINVHCKADKC